MALTNFPNGVSSFGAPILGNIFASLAQGGVTPTNSMFFVSSVIGAAGNDGLSTSAPLATFAQALAKCTAAKGDVIVLMPGHAETVTATNMAPNVSGIQVVGMGTGALRPTFTFGAAAATVTVSAADVSFQNCLFVANFADVVAAFTTTTAKNLSIDSCEFRDTSSILNFIATVSTNTTNNASDGLSITNSKRIGDGATAATCLVAAAGNIDRLNIQNNYVAHALAGNSGLIYQVTTTKVISNAIINNNMMNFVGANAATGAILITTAITHSGLLSNNFVFGARAAATAILVTASSGFKFYNNYYQTAADKSGILMPANV